MRTSYNEETAGKGKIAANWQRFYQEGIASKIPDQVSPGNILAIYSDYESNELGAYSHLIGVEVSSVKKVPAGMIVRTVPSAHYAIVTSERGAIPEIVINVWKKIWQLSPTDLNGQRRVFKTDLEIYDERAKNPKDAQIDVLISVK